MGKASSRKKKRRTLILGFKPWDPNEYNVGVDWGVPEGDLRLQGGASVGKTVSIIKTRAVGKSITYAK